MAAQPNIGGALCESSIITFLVACQKVRLSSVVPSDCQYRTQDFDAKSVRGKSLQKCTIYSVPAEEMAKHCAKIGCPLVSDIAAVTKPRR